MKAVVGILVLIPSAILALPAQADVQTSDDGAVVSKATPEPSPSIDYQNAKPMPLPRSTRPIPRGGDSSSMSFGPARVFRGHDGDGKTDPVQLPKTKASVEPDDQVSPAEFGSAQLPYSTARAAALGDKTETFYPFRAAGKLFFKEGADSFICSASLVAPGLVVTAAHCVANFGKKQYYSSWQYIPSYNDGSAPFGVWLVGRASVLASYYNGTDKCAQKGVVCQNDVAILTLKPKAGKFAGNSTGWFGYGINGYSFNSSKQAHITQLGYPGAIDKGVIMERNDAQGTVIAADANNTEMGSLMTGGSSGGPWLVNFGIAPVLASGTTHGADPANNVVVGVTSFGSTTDAVKRQGASSFTSANIVALVNAACKATPAACK